MKEHYSDDKPTHNEYLLSKANLDQIAGEEEKANTIRNIKKSKRRNQCYWDFCFHQGTGISAQEIN